MNWLLEQAAYSRLTIVARPAVNQQAEVDYVQRVDAANDKGPRILKTAGNQGQINVEGILTDAPDFWAWFVGGGNTTYGEIVSAIADVEMDDELEEIILNVNSPGGSASSEMLAAMDAIHNAKKPVRAVVRDMAASAAFGLVSQADTITAQNALSKVGSVGVIQTSFVQDDVVQVTSTNAPKKNPDASTAEGKKEIRKQIDPIESVFIDTIARGRKTTPDNVKKNFGRGAVVLASAALEKGMIDGIAAEAPTALGDKKRKTKTAAISGTTRESTMDLAKLQAEHPAVYHAAVAVGVDQGVSQERDRVSAHMTYGQMGGPKAMDMAIKAVKEGSGLTDSLKAEYETSRWNKVEDDKIQGESDDLSGADGVDTKSTEEDEAAETKAADESFIAGVKAQLQGGV